MNSYDIVVVGGGMVGAATAIGFAKQGMQVAVIEGFAPQAFDESQAMDIRVSAISQASVAIRTFSSRFRNGAMSSAIRTSPGTVTGSADPLSAPTCR